jgi:pimeloyl-ACP methyl ester carboxylesterase
MGAGVALNLASRHPERARGLVLSRPAWLKGPMPEDNARVYFLIARLIRERGPEAGREEFLRSDAYARLKELSPAGAASLLGEFERERAEETVEIYERLPAGLPVWDGFELASIDVPTLVLANRRDPIHPFEYGEELARGIPGARFEELTPKSMDEEQHAREVQSYVEGSLEPFMEVR